MHDCCVRVRVWLCCRIAQDLSSLVASVCSYAIAGRVQGEAHPAGRAVPPECEYQQTDGIVFLSFLLWRFVQHRVAALQNANAAATTSAAALQCSYFLSAVTHRSPTPLMQLPRAIRGRIWPEARAAMTKGLTGTPGGAPVVLGDAVVTVARPVVAAMGERWQWSHRGRGSCVCEPHVLRCSLSDAVKDDGVWEAVTLATAQHAQHALALAGATAAAFATTVCDGVRARRTASVEPAVVLDAVRYRRVGVCW